MKKYGVLKKAITKDVADFSNAYLLLKRKVYQTFLEKRFINPYSSEVGTFLDTQVPNTYSLYGDAAMDTLLQGLQPLMEKQAGEALSCTYSYARIYKPGDILVRHKDRFSCEISCTLNLGGEPWPIFIDPTGESSVEKIISAHEVVTKPNASKGIKISLKPGDLLFYRGCDLEHWREPFSGSYCSQVFLHYNRASTVEGKKNIYDQRSHLGLPAWFKEK
jgi:hypothetical protein|tara:strand:+ start:623 stop:1279 length:657 start_codon:yes stop_codon:yes gene_type:complete